MSVEKILGMIDSVVIEQSPDKGNVFLAVKRYESLEQAFLPIVLKLKQQRTRMERVIIFCKQRNQCAVLYSFFKYHLGHDFTEPSGAPV